MRALLLVAVSHQLTGGRSNLVYTATAVENLLELFRLSELLQGFSSLNVNSV